MTGLVAGVDVGGTFTDLVILDPATGAVKLAKVPTTLPNQAPGVLNAFDAAGADLADLALIVHGTTTTTNAVLERALCKTGLITTQGFRDVLELGRRTRPQPYGMTGTFTPVIPRDLRMEVAERMDAQGRVLVPLDEDGFRKTVSNLAEMGCESLVIHFLHAYANPAHELRALEIARDRIDRDAVDVFVSAGSNASILRAAQPKPARRLRPRRPARRRPCRWKPRPATSTCGAARCVPCPRIRPYG